MKAPREPIELTRAIPAAAPAPLKYLGGRFQNVGVTGLITTLAKAKNETASTGVVENPPITIHATPSRLGMATCQRYSLSRSACRVHMMMKAAITREALHRCH
jgi:hypothetical protein